MTNLELQHVCHHSLLILTLLCQSLITTTRSMPPPPTVTCVTTGCTLTNSYGIWGDRQPCHASKITYPRTQQELISTIANASKNNQKVKVISKFSHTIPKLACPSVNSKSQNSSILISTENYNSRIEINVSGMSVTADAGVSIRDLINRVEIANLSLVAAPYWEGVSVGGVISTGAHGSSWWGRGGSVHDHVVGITLVVPTTQSDGYAKLVRLKSQDLLLNAAKVSLGLLGVISQVTFSLEPAFKRSITYDFRNDSGIEDEFNDHTKKHEFGDITWYPSRHIAVYRYDDRVPLNTSGDGVNDFLGFQSNPILVSKSIRATETSLEKARNVNGKCVEASSFLAYKKLIGNGLKNNLGIFTGYPVIGHQGKMQTSGSCLYSPQIRTDTACAWDPRVNGLFFYETTAIFTPQNFASFIRDVRKLRDVGKSENFCGVDLYNGFLIRFIKASKAYLGQTEDSVVVDFNYYRASDPLTPRLNQDIYEEVEQMAFFKYGAKPHWAKNRNLAFLNVQKKYPRFDLFLAAKRQLDPKSMFSSEFSDKIVFGKEGIRSDGCGLEGECICSEDRHCSPDNGYFCQRGQIYKEAHVCRYSKSSTS